MEWYGFILGALAVWRLTHLWAAEDGPFRLLARFREWMEGGRLSGLFGCFYCLSLWVAAPVALALGVGWREKLLLWPSLSATAIFLNRLMERAAPETPVYFEEPEKGERNDAMLRAGADETQPERGRAFSRGAGDEGDLRDGDVRVYGEDEFDGDGADDADDVPVRRAGGAGGGGRAG